MNTGNVLQRIWTLSLVILLAGFIGIGQSNAQTYVDGNGPGNDAFDGSQMSVGLFPAGPKATITAAMTAAPNGGTVVILSGNYVANGVLNAAATKSLTLQVRTSGGNVNVVIDGITQDDAARTLTLGVETAASGGTFVTDGTANDLTLTAGGVINNGGLTIGAGGTVTRAAGTLTGTAITTTNYNLTYTSALAANITAGNEANASLGTGTLTFAHTGALVTVPSATTAATITSTSAGNVTFSSSATATAAAAGAFNVSGGATVTVSGALGASNAAGGITTSAASNLTAGATTVSGVAFAHSGTGTVTVASLSLPSNTSVLTVSAAGAFNVTGDVNAGGTAGRTIIGNTSTAIVTVGSVSTGAPFVDAVGDQVDITSVVSNTSTGRVIINGAITEGSVTEALGGGGAGDVEYHAVSLTNAANGRISIGASSTVRGDITNAEADGSADGHGIILAGTTTLTVTPVGGAITGYGDFDGGTLVINYAAGSTDATVAGGHLTDANNVTFTSAVTANAAVGLLGTVADPIEGDVRLQETTHTWLTTFRVLGTLFIEANAQTITGAAAHSFGGISVGSTTGSAFSVVVAATVTVTGTTASLGNTTVGAAFAAAAADVTSSAGGGYTSSFSGKSLTVSGAGAVAIGTTINTTGGVTIASGSTLTLTAPAAASDIAGAADVNGTLAVVGASTIGIGSMDIDATTGTVTTAAATTWNFDGSGFVGGTYTDGGAGDTVNFAVPSAGATISVKPGTTWGALGITGSGRTATITESVNVAGNTTLGNDVIVNLGVNSIVMSGVGGVLSLADEATINNTGTNGSVQFNAVGQRITVTGAPNTTPSLTNVVVNNAAGSPLTIDEPINIAGTLALLDGGVIVDGGQVIGAPYTGVAGPNAGAAAVTFTGTSAAIARTFPNEGITLTSGSLVGNYDLTGSGAAPGTFGAEYSAAQIRNLTISATAAITAPATVATISGNVNVSNVAGTFITAANATVTGNVTVTGTITVAGATIFGFSGVLTTANNAAGVVGGAGTLRFNGNGQTHTHAGNLTVATTRFTGTSIVVNGSIAAGDADGDSEIGVILSDAASSATLNSIQDVNGTVTVNGTLTLNLVLDAAGGADVDGQVTGLVDVNNGGSFTMSSNDAATSLTAGATVNDGGTFTLGSNLGSAAAMVIGDGTQATAATFDLNGNTFSATVAAPSVTVNASTGATAPGFGSTGTLNIGAAGSIAGATNPTIPNLTVNGGAGTPIDSDVTVPGTFTVTAATAMAAGDNVTLSGASAVGQLNASLTSATIGAAGGTLITTGTTIQTNVAAAITITNLNVNSTSTTTMTENIVAAGTATYNVNFLNHDAGVLDITNSTFVFIGDSGAGDDWDYDGGSYAGTGTYTITGAGGFEIDLSTAGNNISIPNLTVNGAANTGLQLDAAGDGMTVTGTLTLNTAATNIETEVGATDATFSVANGATIIRSTGAATNHWDNAPTLGTGLTVRYTSNTAGVISSAELPNAVARLEWEGTAGAATFQLADNRAITTDYLEMSESFSIDDDDDGNNSVTITTGGTVEYDGDGAIFNDNTVPTVATTETFTAAGTVTLLFTNATFTTDDRHWPDAVTGSNVTVTVVGSAGAAANDTVTLHENKSAGTVNVGDGTATATNGSGTLATGAFTLTAATLNVNADGIVTGTVNVSTALASTGTTAAVAITAQGSVSITGGVPGALTMNGTTAQTLTVPAGGFVLVAALTINNAAGVTHSGGAITTAAGVAGLTLTSGVFTTAGLTITHGGPGAQGFTQTGGCVFGNVTKTIIGTGVAAAPADRLQYPLCTSTGTPRTAAITFNTPGNILAGAGTALVTVRTDQAGENGAVDLSGTNGLPVTANGVNLARYPTGPSFWWTITPNFTMSPSLQYDVELRGGSYPNFSSSCDTAACDINEIFPIRRHVGSNNNQWAVASTTIDNFLSSANSPVVIGRAGTGALQTSGTIFTYGLKSIFAAAAGAQTYATTTGNTHVVDLSGAFTGFTGALTYTAVASNASGVTSPALTDITGNNLTLTGGADAGAATVTVTAQDSFGGSATATFTVNNSAALVANAVDMDRALNVGGTSTATFDDAFDGGAAVVAYTAASSDASVTVASDGTTVTITAASTGSATITLTGVDGSSTAVTVTKTFTVTVNANVSVAAATADMSVAQGASADVDASGTFANGTGAVAVTVSGGNTTAGATIAGTTVTVTGLAAYSGSPLADTAPVTITLTGTDTLGGTATDAFDVSVTPVLGDLDGSGGPSAASASIALDASLGLVTLTAKQQTAVDFNNDGNVTAFDAALIFNAAANSKGEVEANPATDLAFGEIVHEGNVISIPVQVVGEINDVVSASFATKIDPELATITGITSELGDGWLVKNVISEDGTINLAIAGIGDMTVGGTIATINIELANTGVQFNLGAEGAINNNPTMSIDAVEVAELPDTFALHGNYPNPFNPTTSINFDLPESADVEIQVVDMIGRQVMVLPAATLAAGSNRTVQIDASRLASGTYFYRVIAKMESKTLVETGRMMLVK